MGHDVPPFKSDVLSCWTVSRRLKHIIMLTPHRSIFRRRQMHLQAYGSPRVRLQQLSMYYTTATAFFFTHTRETGNRYYNIMFFDKQQCHQNITNYNTTQASTNIWVHTCTLYNAVIGECSTRIISNVRYLEKMVLCSL